MSFIQLIFAVFIFAPHTFAASIYLSTSDVNQKSSVRNQLVQDGISSNLFVEKPNDDSIILALPDQVDAQLSALRSKPYANQWLIVLDPKVKKISLIQSLQGVFPASRISAQDKIESAVERVNEILTEQNRLHQGVAGLGTITAPDTSQDEDSVGPLGSALITQSGLLDATGIHAIIHTASGAMTFSGPGFEPSVKSVQNSLINAIALAREYHHQRVALPIIAGSIFRNRINNGAGIALCSLVDAIVDTLAAEGAGMQLILTVRADNPQEGPCIRQSLKRLNDSDRKMIELDDQVEWALVKFKTHHATAIINSANMEFLFGGGVSGIVADATNGIIPPDHAAHESKRDRAVGTDPLQSRKIDAEAVEKIKLF